MSNTIRRVSDHPMKRTFDATSRDTALRAEDGWVDMDVRWLFTRDSVGAEHSVFGITVFPPGSKHDIHRHPNAEEFEYLVSGNGIARVGDADVELGPGEVVFVPKNDYHGFENTGDEPVFMVLGYAGAASLAEAGYTTERLEQALGGGRISFSQPDVAVHERRLEPGRMPGIPAVGAPFDRLDAAVAGKGDAS